VVAELVLVRPMKVLIVFAVIYIPLMIILGEVIHAQGRKLLQHAFGSGSVVANAISVLLRIGWYMTSAGLLLWNLGSAVGGSAELSFFAAFQEVSFRLGVALFTVGVLHGLNILALSLFHRKNT
jgi:hypothetical protein